MAEGWAVTDDGEIKIGTVRETRRASLIQFLVVDRDVLITVWDTDEELERMWNENSHGAHLGKVTVTNGGGSG